jgi:phosphohistidine phosphatase
MKALLILRHAKAKRGSGDDHDRPLTTRGERDAERIGEMVDKLDLNPHLVVSSDAVRAHETALFAAQAFCYNAEDIVLTDRLYLSPVEEQLGIVRGLSDEHDLVMLVGHNPSFEDLIELFTGEMITLRTANLAHIELNIESWIDADEESGELMAVYSPRAELTA